MSDIKGILKELNVKKQLNELKRKIENGELSNDKIELLCGIAGIEKPKCSFEHQEEVEKFFNNENFIKAYKKLSDLDLSNTDFGDLTINDDHDGYGTHLTYFSICKNPNDEKEDHEYEEFEIISKSALITHIENLIEHEVDENLCDVPSSLVDNIPSIENINDIVNLTYTIDRDMIEENICDYAEVNDDFSYLSKEEVFQEFTVNDKDFFIYSRDKCVISILDY